MSNPKGNEPTLVKFKNKWNSGATKTIRVPVAIAEQVLEYARKLDKSQSATNSNFAKNKSEIAGIINQLITDLKSQVATKKFEVEQLEKKIAEVKALTEKPALTIISNKLVPPLGAEGGWSEATQLVRAKQQ